MAAIAKVEPLTHARALRGPFDYRLPERMESVGVGSVLVVPFGRRRALGVVVDTAERSELPQERLVEPLSVIDPEVTPQLVELGLWVAAEYCSTPARGLGLVLPPGTGPDRSGRPRVGKRTALHVTLTDAGRATLAAGGASPSGIGRKLGARQLEVLELLEGSGSGLTAGDLAARVASARDAVKRLAERGYVEVTEVDHRRRPVERAVGALRRVTDLTAEQTEALAAISRAQAAGGESQELLLHGVTGSGKTEVYLAAVEEALSRGRTAIVLVPEISLTPQTVTRFKHRFGERIALLHSGLSAGERYDEWSALRSGDAQVCIGPRSAVFAPLADIGLIVVDEEHDSSYKQEQDPRYDAREVAGYRARQEGAVVVCGSATPRAESFARLERLTLRDRIDERRLPPVEILDMRNSRAILHPATFDALQEVRRQGQKAIVMLNRRGWSSFLTCRTCGRAWECPNCDVTLTLHRARGRLVCHHCAHVESVATRCPDCDSTAVAQFGAGTEQLEAELNRALDEMEVFRLDSDTTRAKDSVVDLLQRFEQATSGVLLGTQMVAKGHDFPEVTLAVVVDADATLRFPDFRAEERTFQLITQLAGRAGRGPGGGRVLVQTLAPGAPAIVCAAAHDVDRFMASELGRRRELSYPPFGTLIKIVCGSTNEATAESAATAIAVALGAGTCAPELLPQVPEYTVLGPAPLFRVKGKHRVQLMLKTEPAKRAAAISATRRAVDAVAGKFAKQRVSFAVDVDPQ